MKKLKQAVKKVVLATKNVAKQAKAISKEAVEQVKWAMKNPDQFKQKVSQAYESIKHMKLAKITDDMTWREKGKTALSNVGILAAQYVQGTIEGRMASIKSFLEDGKATIDSWKYYTDPKEGANRRVELVQSIKYTVTHPKETIQNRISSYKETFNNFKETLSNGNVYDWAYQMNKTTTDIGLEVIGSKGSRLVIKESINVIEGNKGKINFNNNNNKNNNNNSQNVDERKTEDSKGTGNSIGNSASRSADLAKQPLQVIQNRYPNEIQQGKSFEYVLENGQVKIRDGIKEVDFVIDINGNLKIGRGHSYLANGFNVQAAGKLKVDANGNVRRITNELGYYTPTAEQAKNYEQIFNCVGINTKNAWLEIYQLELTKSGYVNLGKLKKIQSTKLK